jgi:hypothetical protein
MFYGHPSYVHPDDSLRMINDHLAILRVDARSKELAHCVQHVQQVQRRRQPLLHRNFIRSSRLLRRVIGVRIVLARLPCQEPQCSASTPS